MLHGKQKGRKEGEGKQERESSSKGLVLEPTCLLGPWATASRPARPRVPWPPWSQALGLVRYLFLQARAASEPVQALALACREGEQEARRLFCVVLKNIYVYKIITYGSWLLFGC